MISLIQIERTPVIVHLFDETANLVCNEIVRAHALVDLFYGEGVTDDKLVEEQAKTADWLTDQVNLLMEAVNAARQKKEAVYNNN